MTMRRPSGRSYDEMRAVRIVRNFTKHAEGSVLIEFGDTRVICTASFVFILSEFLSVWCEYVKTRSEKVVDYVKISDNAPYILTVIILFLESKLAKKYHDRFNPFEEASEDKGKGVVYPKIVEILVKRDEALLSENVEFDSELTHSSIQGCPMRSLLSLSIIYVLFIIIH